MTWDGEERRENLAVEVMREMREWLDKHEEEEVKKYESIRSELRRNQDRIEQMSQSTLSVIQQQNQSLQEIHKLFKAAFPEGNADAHRMAHEAWMEKEKADREFWTKLKQHVINWAVVAALGWGGIIIWAAFAKGPNG
jgi:hypothetical protein